MGAFLHRDQLARKMTPEQFAEAQRSAWESRGLSCLSWTQQVVKKSRESADTPLPRLGLEPPEKVLIGCGASWLGLGVSKLLARRCGSFGESGDMDRPGWEVECLLSWEGFLNETIHATKEALH